MDKIDKIDKVDKIVKIQSIINKVVGVIFGIANLLWIINFARFFYLYHFTGILWMFMYPDRVLATNMLIGSIGIYLSILLFKDKLKMKLFLIAEFLLALFANYITNNYHEFW